MVFRFGSNTRAKKKSKPRLLRSKKLLICVCKTSSKASVMRVINKFLISVALCVFASNVSAAEQADFESSLTKVGQQAPEINWVTLDGQRCDNKSFHGKVVLINFFATWCGPCLQEMPHLQKEAWEKFK